MHKNIVNIAEESKECTKYGKKIQLSNTEKRIKTIATAHAARIGN